MYVSIFQNINEVRITCCVHFKCFLALNVFQIIYFSPLHYNLLTPFKVKIESHNIMVTFYSRCFVLTFVKPRQDIFSVLKLASRKGTFSYHKRGNFAGGRTQHCLITHKHPVNRIQSMLFIDSL